MRILIIEAVLTKKNKKWSLQKCLPLSGFEIQLRPILDIFCMVSVSPAALNTV
jgi:hypothetical protein